MQSRVVAVIAVVMLVVGASATYAWFTVGGQQSVTVTEVKEGNLLFMQVGSSLYFADEVTPDTVVPVDGYAYFTNTTITFYGVTFKSVCPTTLAGCPGSGSGATSVGIPGTYTEVTVQFPDAKRETVFGSVQSQVFATYVTNHSGPRAGVAFEYISLTKSYRVFLLVTPYSAPQQGA